MSCENSGVGLKGCVVRTEGAGLKRSLMRIEVVGLKGCLVRPEGWGLLKGVS